METELRQSRVVERRGRQERRGKKGEKLEEKIGDKALAVRHLEVSGGRQARVCKGEACGV